MTKILDASVAFKWFFTDEPFFSKADNILSELGRDPSSFIVPDFFFLELASAILRRSGDAQFAHTAIKTLYKLGLRTVPVNGDPLLEAINIAAKSGIAVYDALYVALAKMFDGKWITSDEKALSRLGKLSKFASLLQST